MSGLQSSIIPSQPEMQIILFQPQPQPTTHAKRIRDGQKEGDCSKSTINFNFSLASKEAGTEQKKLRANWQFSRQLNVLERHLSLISDPTNLQSSVKLIDRCFEKAKTLSNTVDPKLQEQLTLLEARYKSLQKGF